ncbi:MAG: hypothetical protein GY705_09105 [Bacteroidetes bacterium]|nr:hypothetical protein [Bacteroidota bacterium]
MKQKIEALPEGAVITFDDFSELPNKRAVALCLSRLKKEGELERLEKGKYYIPKKTKFGTLGPSESSIIQGLLKGDEGSYISGVTAYNKLGLTTQVANEITIVGSKYNRKAIVGKIKVKYIKGKAPVNKQNILLLQILDAVNDVKKIPDTTVSSAIMILKRKIQSLSLYEKQEMIKLSQFYRPYVRAIVGEIFEEEGIKEVEELRSSMNPLTFFKFNISKEILPLQKKWNLI